jgi:N-acetylmuramoyl-L-alanine amidase
MKKVRRDARSRRRKIRWKFVLPFLVLISLILYIIITLMFPHKVAVIQPKYTVCDYSLSKAQAVFKTMSYTDTDNLSEHLYYGETLNIYNETFELGKDDPFVGKTVVLRNICDGTELVYMMESNIDRQIPLDSLPQGFYEVYVMENLVKTRLVSQDAFYDEFYTIRRHNGLGMEVEIVADKRLIESPIENQTILDKNYVFIRVTEKEVPEAIYDVVIDPSKYQTSDDNIVKNDVNVAEALFVSATLLKEKLEAYGLKVFITRDNEIIDRWGVDGRMAKIYNVKAKYYIALDINGSTNANDKGARIIYSHYTSNRFATAVFDAYLQLDDLTIYGVGSPGNKLGIISGRVLEDKMDVNTDVRETGGKILGAAKYSETSAENATFALDNPYGVQAILLDLLFISNQHDYDLYTTQHDALIENIALGFADYLQLEKVSQ